MSYPILKNSQGKLNSAEKVYNQILRDIISNELKPGQILSEPDLSEMYQISRTPVREALNKLEGEGFVIRNGSKRQVYHMTSDDINQLFELKIAIEGMIAYKAALSVDEHMRREMQVIAADMELYIGVGKGNANTIVLDKWLELDNRFHYLLYQMAHNDRARVIVDNLNAQWHRYRVGISAIAGHLERSVAEHLKIARAILHKNPSAAKEAMEEHFKNLQSHINTLMDIFSNS